jgi:hypothetical protein
MKKKGVRRQASGVRPKKKGVRRQASGVRPKRQSARKALRRPEARGPRPPSATRWVRFVAKHGVVLASARGPVPCVAEAVADEPIVGSWWAHPKGQAIFAALSEIDDSVDVRCFKLVDGKVTFVHRRLWPAVARLAREGELAADAVASLQQEHMPTGEHRNIVTPYPEWVDDATALAATKLTLDDARAQLPWLAGAPSKRPSAGPRRPRRPR